MTQAGIYRYRRSIDGYTQNEKLNINEVTQDAAGFAVDGAIYLVKTNGNIIKFFNGKKTDTSFEILENDFTNIKVWTSPDSKFIYLFSGGVGRLVVLNKDGKLEKQYEFENQKKPRSLTINEQAGLAYFANDNKIYEFKLTHLNKNK